MEFLMEGFATMGFAAPLEVKQFLSKETGYWLALHHAVLRHPTNRRRQGSQAVVEAASPFLLQLPTRLSALRVWLLSLWTPSQQLVFGVSLLVSSIYLA